MLRIGICDDSADARIALKAALERAMNRRKGEGTFFEFSSGEGLLRWLEKHAGELDMVFLDIVMPVKDGHSAIAEIMEVNPKADIVIVSSVGTQAQLRQAIQLGAKDFIQKPLNVRQIESILKSRFEGRE